MKMPPYVTFSGTCRDAFETYTRIFGGEVLFFQLYDEMPGAEVRPGTSLPLHGQAPLDKKTKDSRD
ncbi:hypothetical protein XMM379_002086 [Aliiroseovarius sp. xm-m-379]|uniref:hypothetical protein n=1 Tax=unclassified Aliiroseovarius TaxID=2623558 RepID=UPI001569C9CB|nr:MULTISPECIES: hypothetical protein [unclassified Aliiroseovarius]NRP13966.1 hypothetical protein [Aliiroseovarius sp. xm-d-517]NRP25389.1 hypothetical protein [Aliiroseovarius sp. xm-m-379]NRP29381.1 hypothetical protein [Aliiroseovarius sp. xm-m-314]NRP34188.1 hypothetical protein [Aliiroseovarius sp. xm-a-104]NRP41853.1 hypothetical protein [Aliiroseovarius sp. xm-m-339-2]